MDQNLNYETAFAELQEIESEIVNESITIDLLADKIRRASQLIAFCKSRLRATEEEVNNVINGMDRDDQAS